MIKQDITDAKEKPVDILFYGKLALSAITAGACLYLGGPTASTSARFIYDNVYAIKYGLPAFYEPSYWLSYMPMREHVAHVAYQYGPQLAGAVVAPLTYKATDGLGWLSNKLNALFKKKSPQATIIILGSQPKEKDETNITLSVPANPLAEMTDEELNLEIEKIISQLKALKLSDENPKEEDGFILDNEGTYGIAVLFAKEDEAEKTDEAKIPLAQLDSTMPVQPCV